MAFGLKKFHIGMRKVKSLLAVILAFLMWQLVRIIFPQLDFHPLYGYLYAIIEMRDTPQKTKKNGINRIKATIIGLLIGLLFVSFSINLGEMISTTWQMNLIDLGLILVGVLVALCVAESTDCGTFCGIAAIIVVICMISHADEDRYFYAIMRTFQTFIGVASAFIINYTVKARGQAEPNCDAEAEQNTKTEK